MRAHQRIKELEAELDGCRCGKLGVLEPGSDRRSRTEHSLAEALHSLREDNEPMSPAEFLRISRLPSSISAS